MIEALFVKSDTKRGTLIGIKAVVAAVVIAMAVITPQLVHVALGAPGGAKWLPMYFPVLLGAFLLGGRMGTVVGALAPVVSFAFTSAFGNAMPTAARLPYMMAELAVMALAAGWTARAVSRNKFAVLWAVPLSFAAGRLSFLALASVMGQYQMAFAQIRTGIVGVLVQCALVPVIVMLTVTAKENHNA